MSTEPVNIALVINELGLGGTQKGLVAHAVRFDRSRFRPQVIGVHDLGPRARELEAAGVPVQCADGDRRRLAELLQGSELVHAWRANPADVTLPRATRAAGAGILVETSVFGLVDRSVPRGWFGCRLFLSRSCALRHRRRAGVELEAFCRRNRVMPLPLDAARLRAAALPAEEARRRLGLDPSRPVIGRLGRADDMKWRDLIVEMIPPLLERVPGAQILLVGTTPAKRRLLDRRGVLDSCLLHDMVADDRELASLYAACDVFVTAAEIGESQGLAMGEAMALEIPVVTCSTPWVDNAQLEYVEHDRTGYVANHPRPFAEAVAALVRDPACRRRFGAAARARVEEMLDPAVLTGRLEGLYEALIAGEPPPVDWTPGVDELAAFDDGSRARASAEFAPLSSRERLEARLTRERERLRRLRGLLRPRMLPLGAGMVRARVAELRSARHPSGEGTVQR
jgi:hypothetical protein